MSVSDRPRSVTVPPADDVQAALICCLLRALWKVDCGQLRQNRTQQQRPWWKL